MPPVRPLPPKDAERIVASVLGPEVRRSIESLQPRSRMSFRHTPGAPVMATPETQPASPTGTPLIPPKVVPFVLAGSGVLALLAEELTNPGPWGLSRILGFGAKVLGLLFLGASPGLRKKDGA